MSLNYRQLDLHCRMHILWKPLPFSTDHLQFWYKEDHDRALCSLDDLEVNRPRRNCDVKFGLLTLAAFQSSRAFIDLPSRSSYKYT